MARSSRVAVWTRGTGRIAEKYEGEPMTGAVIAAPNATAELVAALGGVHGVR